MRYGAIEAGGTKMICAVVLSDGSIEERVSIPTRGPQETMREVREWFETRPVQAFGIAAFGPVCLDPHDPFYGHILETTKTEWRYYDLLEEMRCFGVPISLDTDVNGACLGEWAFGQAKGLRDVVYLTVGTGIGAGILVNGRPVHGMLHPEAGHVRIVRAQNDNAKSVCGYHDSCVEGLASGTALWARCGRPASELSETDAVWELETDYLAQAIVNYIMVVSPQKIILGGGVMKQKQLFPLIRKKVSAYLGGYLVTEELKDMKSYICEASLQDDQGILGCLALCLLENETISL